MNHLAVAICKQISRESLGPWLACDSDLFGRRQVSFRGCLFGFRRSVVFKRCDEPVFEKVAARWRIRAVERTHVFYGASQARRAVDARGINGKFYRKELVCPPAVF